MAKRQVGIAGIEFDAAPAKPRQLRVDVRFQFTHGFRRRERELLGQRHAHLMQERLALQLAHVTHHAIHDQRQQIEPPFRRLLGAKPAQQRGVFHRRCHYLSPSM
ncbi:hypothetical protein D3C76_1533590 [compost metagenome]